MKLLQYLVLISLIVGATSCANRTSGPTGGDKDTIPPVVIRSNPQNEAVNYKKKEITVYFNENITLDKVTENVVVSPPQKTQPIVKANAKVLTVSLQDELQDSTTYSILFGNAIVDLNEKNPLENYVFSFATGSELDSLRVSGKLISAENLDPIANVAVGIHANLHDTAIIKDQFRRIAKTDSEGKFTIQNVKSGKYKIYALDDLNRDFTYQPGEGVAFYDSIIIPEVHLIQKFDTIWTDSVSIDTIHITSRYDYEPEGILLKLFKEKKKRQYLVKSERADEKYFNLFFNDKQDSLPIITPLNFDVNTSFLIDSSINLDSLTYWIPDSAVYKQDTLSMSIQYLKTDSLFNYVSAIDTVSLYQRKARQSTKSKAAKQEEEEVKALGFKTNASGSFDIYKDIIFEFEEPVDSAFIEKLQLNLMVDSVLTEKEFVWFRNDSIAKTYALRYPWEPEQNFELTIDSAAFISIYNKVSHGMNTKFKIKSLEDYATLVITLEDFDEQAFIQVLDAKEQIIQAKRAKADGVVFEYLKPGDYYLRMFIDENMNDTWDTGDLENRLHPEEVIYYPKKLSLRANWELEETWNHQNSKYKNTKPKELIQAKKK